MATVTLTWRFDHLINWPGNLFNAQEGSGTVVTSRSATSLGITLGDESGFEGYKIHVTGSGFSYLSGVPTAGKMSQLRIMDGSGNTVITFGNLGANPISKDLSQFYSNMFGSPSDDTGPGPDGYMVWNHLLAGKDSIFGTHGNDQRGLVGVDAGNDTYYMRGGDDVVQVGVGNDTYYGGNGFDRLTIQNSAFSEGSTAIRGATINVQKGVLLDPWGGTDKFKGFEQFEGSRFNDRFVGHNARDDNFAGLRGRDVIDGGANTYVNGQRSNDNDFVDYRNDYWHGGKHGIVADLQTSLTDGSIRGFVRDGFGNMDTVIDIENIDGTRFNDSLTGSRVNNNFGGGEGRDAYSGGRGHDTISFSTWFVSNPHGVKVDLSRGSRQIIDDGFGNTETATSIEGIIATDANDRLKGSLRNEYFTGNGGADLMTGGGGVDTFHWHDQTHFDDGDRVTDFSAKDRLSFQTDNFVGMNRTLHLVNGTAAETAEGTFLYDAATDTLTWDSNGTGIGGRSVIAILDNVSSLSASNFELWG